MFKSARKLLLKSPAFRILNPFKFNLSFLKEYHLLLNENFAIWKGCENVITSQVKVLLWLNYLRVGQYAVLYIFADEQNELLQIVFFDSIHFFRLPVEYCFVFATFGLLTNFTVKQLFFNSHCLKLVNLVYPVLFLHHDGYFLQYSRKEEGQRSTSRIITDKLRLYVTLFSPFSLIGAFWIIMTETTFFITVRRNLYVSPISFIYFCAAQISLILDYISILLFVSISLLNSTAFAALTLIIFARLNQVNSLLEAVSARHFNFFLFYKFSLFHTRTLGHVFLADTVCGQIILLMVVLFTPMNAYMFMTLILGKIQIPVLYPFIGAVFIGQFTVLFLFHYATTWYGTKIHSHAKRLLHLSVNSCCGNGSKNDFRSKLHSLHAKVKVHNYVEKFLTRKRYGIAYGGPRGVNTVSMNSFAKVRFLVNFTNN